MTAKEMAKYLSEFPPESEVKILVVNSKKRIKYDIAKGLYITDAGFPLIGIEVDGEEPFDAEEIAAAEEDENA